MMISDSKKQEAHEKLMALAPERGTGLVATGETAQDLYPPEKFAAVDWSKRLCAVLGVNSDKWLRVVAYWFSYANAHGQADLAAITPVQSSLGSRTVTKLHDSLKTMLGWALYGEACDSFYFSEEQAPNFKVDVEMARDALAAALADKSGTPAEQPTGTPERLREVVEQIVLRGCCCWSIKDAVQEHRANCIVPLAEAALAAAPQGTLGEQEKK
jgi:hypothetical protein